VFNSPNGGVPRDDLRQILPGCQQMTNVPNSVETLPKISIAWVGRTKVTDRRPTTDRRTDDDIIIANVKERWKTRAVIMNLLKVMRLLVMPSARIPNRIVSWRIIVAPSGECDRDVINSWETINSAIAERPRCRVG